MLGKEREREGKGIKERKMGKAKKKEIAETGMSERKGVREKARESR